MAVFTRESIDQFRRERRLAESAPSMLGLLKKLAWYYELNDCHGRDDDDALEVPIIDLRNAYELVSALGEKPSP